MTKLDKLMREARKVMRWRGHNPITDWKETGRAMLHCCNEGCNMGVHVIVKPQPNEIDIGGEAVALNCNVATATNQRLDRFVAQADQIRMDAVMGC